MPLFEYDAGIISKESPLTLNVPLEKSISFLSYCISTSFFIISLRSFSIPVLKLNVSFLYSSGLPSPYIHETDATIITSRLSNNADVAE